jgi:iron uptake system component EfeO
VLVAAGLVASAAHTAHEAGWLNTGQAQAIDLSWLVVPGTWTASLLTGMLGLQPRPTVVEAAAYLVYLIPMALFVLWPQRPGVRARSAMRSAAPVATVLLVLLVIAGCGSSSSSSGGASQGSKLVKVQLTDAGCSPAQLKLDAGPTTFSVSNAGTSRVSEFEVLDGDRILGEKENLVAGLSGRFDLNLKPGRYTMSCPGGTNTATGAMLVGGSAVAAGDDPQLTAATASYRSYVETQVATLVKRTQAFTDAVKAGDVAKAKSLFAGARAPYETIEPVAESFGGLDPAIDARVNDVAKGDKWTGFHRIEKALWVDNSTKGMAPVADKLMADVHKLQDKVQGLSYQPEEMTNGANGLLDEVSASKITGEEDRYSHTDLSDFEANVDGSQTTFGLLAPALRAKDATLATRIDKRFGAVNSALDGLKTGGDYPSYATVDKAQRRQLSQLVDALAEPMSQVAAKLQG